MKTYADLKVGDKITDPKHIELTFCAVNEARTGGKLKMYIFKRIGGDVIMRWQFPTATIAP
jgi:hypothetical protein